MKKAWCFESDLVEVEALVDKAIYLTGAAENEKLRSVRTANGLLMFAADHLLCCRRLGLSSDDEPTTEAIDKVIENATALLSCSSSEYLRLSSSKRASLRSVIYAMLLCYRDDAQVSGQEGKDAKATLDDGMVECTAPFDEVDIEPSEARQGAIYEVLVGTGFLGWQTATHSRGKWYAEPGTHFLAYQSSVTSVRIPRSVIGGHVKQVLVCYRSALPAAGEEIADRDAREVIRGAADFVVYGAADSYDMADASERSTSWWRVHDAVLRGYLRFRVHIDDSLSDAA